MTALRLVRLAHVGFRNLDRFVYEPGAGLNVLSGDNGAGKSSLLEAVHYLGTGKSFRGAKVEDLVQDGAEGARLEGTFDTEVGKRIVAVSLPRAATRAFTVDGKRPRSRSALRALFPMVLFHPGDLSLASGGADGRRGYLDGLLECVDPTYAAVIEDYEKALRARNRLLKAESPARREVRIYDELLASRGAIVGSARAALAESLAPRIEADFSAIVGDTVPVRVRYRPRVEPTVAALRTALERAYEKDVARGFTADGPHADDLQLEVRAAAARHHASQGQHRVLALAMKLAELELLEDRLGTRPLLLLDDVSSELDRERTSRFFARIDQARGQVFVTTTQPDLIVGSSHRADVRIAAGRLV